MQKTLSRPGLTGFEMFLSFGYITYHQCPGALLRGVHDDGECVLWSWGKGKGFCKRRTLIVFFCSFSM